MKSTKSILKEYLGTQPIIEKLLEEEKYEIIEDFLKIKRDTIKLYDREYKEWLENEHSGN